MSDAAGGESVAHDATVDSTPVDDTARQSAIAAARVQVDNARAKIETLQAHVEGAKQSLTESEADLAALESQE